MSIFSEASSLADPYAFLSLQLKCTYLVPAKAPLPEEAIINRNKVVEERRRTTRKAQHKERQIAKRDRNDNRITRQKAGECGISSDEDPSPESSWSGDIASVAEDCSDMSGSSSSSPPHATEVSSSRRPQTAAHDKNVGSSSRQAAHPAREDQQMVRPRVAPSRTGASKSQRAAPRQAEPPRRSEERPAPIHQLYDGSDRPNSDSLQRRRSWGKSTDSESTPSTPQVVDFGAAPRRLQSLLIRGGEAPDVHVSLVADGIQGPTPAVVEVGGSAPERTVERVATVEAADKSGAAPEQGSSGHPAKKPQVCS
jgi:hypothetical protein